MLVLDTARDSIDVMRHFNGVVISESRMDRERMKFFIRLANVQEEIVDIAICHFLAERLVFHTYAPGKSWYTGDGQFEALYGTLTVRVGCQYGPVFKGYLLEIWEAGRQVCWIYEPQDVLRRFHQTIKEKVSEIAPPAPAVKAGDQEELERIKNILSSVP